jgi:hypothetical protein
MARVQAQIGQLVGIEYSVYMLDNGVLRCGPVECDFLNQPIVDSR